MSAVLITGMSCAGKSTIAAVLTRRGLAAIDSDNDPLLARSVDSAGNVVDDPVAPDFAWLARLDAPGRDNDWGRIGDTREYLRRRLPEYQDRLRAFGAIPIDATLPLDHVVDAILSHPRSPAGGHDDPVERYPDAAGPCPCLGCV